MTRFLSEALAAKEPEFRLGLQRLERAHGNPSHDIRVSSAVLQETQRKLVELGLDPTDTTSEELYHVLLERVKTADADLVKQLRTRAATHINAEADVVDGMSHVLQDMVRSQHCFALKATSLKTLLRKQPPKHALKQLGYRSLPSFLKHESPALALSAAWLTESSSWRKHFMDSYRKLKPSDFEQRHVTIAHPTSKRWVELANSVVDAQRHNLISFRELGAIVLLPLPKQQSAGTVTASLSLALHELNELLAASTYLKLSQVRADFGEQVHHVATSEPHVSSTVLDRPVPWQLIQRYYARFSDQLAASGFEPNVTADDMSWHSVEQTLSTITPHFNLWHGTSHLGLMHGGKLVSLNLVDAALNLCNNVPFEKRIVQAFQQSLFHELLLQYLSRDAVEQTVLDQLQPRLAVETVNS